MTGMTDPGHDSPGTPDRVVQASAADGEAMTASELRAFLDELGRDVPDATVSIRAVAGHRGDITSIVAVSPPAPGAGGRQFPGDIVRDAATLVESIEREDQQTAMILYTQMSSTSVWAMAKLLARHCLMLAHQLYGDDVSGWFAVLRHIGNAMDAGAGEI